MYLQASRLGCRDEGIFHLCVHRYWRSYWLTRARTTLVLGLFPFSPEMEKSRPVIHGENHKAQEDFLEEFGGEEESHFAPFFCMPPISFAFVIICLPT